MKAKIGQSTRQTSAKVNGQTDFAYLGTGAGKQEWMQIAGIGYLPLEPQKQKHFTASFQIEPGQHDLLPFWPHHEIVPLDRQRIHRFLY